MDGLVSVHFLWLFCSVSTVWWHCLGETPLSIHSHATCWRKVNNEVNSERWSRKLQYPDRVRTSHVHLLTSVRVLFCINLLNHYVWLSLGVLSWTVPVWYRTNTSMLSARIWLSLEHSLVVTLTFFWHLWLASGVGLSFIDIRILIWTLDRDISRDW